MKKLSKLIAIFLCISLVTACITGVAPLMNAQTNNLLSNADFESYDVEKNSFEGWTFFATGNNTRTLSKTKGLNGENAALITSIDNESMASVFQQFTVDPGKSYRVSVWLKVTGDNSDVFDVAGWGTGISLNIFSDDKSVNLTSDSIKDVMSWRKISYIIDAENIPDNITKLTFEILMHATRGCLYIDNASVVEYNGEEDEPQYLYNMSFEDGNGSNIWDWTHGGRTDIYTAEITGETAYEGENSLYFNSTDHNQVVYINQAVNGLNSQYRYIFSCFAKASTEAYSYLGAGIRIGIEYCDSNGAVQNIWSADGFQQAADWTQISLNFTIPEGATDVKAYVQSNCIKGSYYVDALNIMSIGQADGFANYSFEAFDGENFPCWTWYYGNNGEGQNTLTQGDLGYEGKAAVISKSMLDNNVNLMQSLDFALDSEKDYIISVYARATYSENAPWDMRGWGHAKLRVSDGITTLESKSLTDIGPWQKLSIIVESASLSADKNWTVDFDMYGMTGVVYLDNVTIAEYHGSEEQQVYEPLYNLGFEEGDGNAFDYWRFTGTESTVITESETVRNGQRAVAVTSVSTGAVNRLYQSIYNSDADSHYVLSAYVKTEGALEISYDGAGVKLEIKYTDSEGVECVAVSTSVKVAEDWTQIRLPFNIPEGSTNPTAIIVTDCMKGTAYIDDLEIGELSIGDVNYDSQFNALDVVRLKKYVAQTLNDIYAPLSDVDFDGEINAYDLSVLRDGLLNGGIVNYSLQVWTEDSLTRVAKNSQSNGETAVSLFAAKGEYESFQLVTAATSENTIIKNIKIGDFENESGDIIDSLENVTVYREHYVTCLVSSPESANVTKDSVGEIPDALIPAVSPVTGESLGSSARFYAFPYKLNNNECQPFFIDVKIPRDAKSGDYTANYTVYTNEGIKAGKISLKVWDITLSATQTQGSYFLLKGENNALKAEEAAKNRMFIDAVDSNQEEELNLKYGYNNANVGFWSGADNKNPVMSAAPTENQVAESIGLHSSKMKLFNYTADEIDKYVTDLKDGIIDYAKVLHQYNIKQLLTITPTEELLDDGTGKPVVDIWTVLPKNFETNIDIIETARQKGCEIWTYNCLAQDGYSPKFLLDYPLINFRIHPGFINYSLGVDGFLYWSLDNYGELADPWTALNDQVDCTVYNGDGILFYPGEDVGLKDTFVPSLRAKAIRDGFEDYELCVATDTTCDEISGIASSFSNWTQDKDVLLSGRKAIGDMN